MQPDSPDAPAHDVLHPAAAPPRTRPRDPLGRGRAARRARPAGVLVIDDSTLDKPYATQIELVTRHWSGKHHAVVRGST